MKGDPQGGVRSGPVRGSRGNPGPRFSSIQGDEQTHSAPARTRWLRMRIHGPGVALRVSRGSATARRPIRRDRDRYRDAGQSFAEFALILPVLITLVLGAIAFGRVMQSWVSSESSAKAGASWGASHLQNATQALEPAYALHK